MGKYNIGTEQYNNGVKIEAFYEFLCSAPLDNIETIRKMYIYYQNFISSYKYTMYEYDNAYDFKEENGWCARAFLEKAHLSHQLMIRLTHDSYLAILLHKLDYESYKKIIKGLYCYFEYSDAEVNPPLKNTNYKTKEYVLTKEQYIQKLIGLQHISTNVGDYIDTSSLGSIIEFEKELIKPDEKIKCLRLEQVIPYGDLKMFK